MSKQIARSMLTGRLGDGLDMIDLRQGIFCCNLSPSHNLTMTPASFALDVDVSGVFCLAAVVADCNVCVKRTIRRWTRYYIFKAGPSAFVLVDILKI